MKSRKKIQNQLKLENYKHQIPKQTSKNSKKPFRFIIGFKAQFPLLLLALLVSIKSAYCYTHMECKSFRESGKIGESGKIRAG